MKRLIASFELILISFTITAQINLEHTFTSNYQGISWFVSNSKGIMYYTSDTVTNQVKLFNEDYSLYKNVTIDRPVGYSMVIYLPSEQLFNTNSSIEFICTFWKSNLSRIKIYDDNATVIKDFGLYNYSAYPYLVTKGSLNKLIIKALAKNPSSQYVDEIYSLPGSIPSSISKLESLNMLPAYPNPSRAIINLPYVLKKGQTAIMRIYNINGQLSDQKEIDSSFDRIILNVESYHPGLYFYEYNGITNKFIVN